ncbi:MAG TPA: MEDS domain-containing protein [Candidatus Binataceae bacterium]|nr:MEDS domain-containing protein [Candidatus Binataceae bacterium]
MITCRLRFPELLHLHDPAAAQHVVHFYEDDAFVVGNVSYFAGQALMADSSVLIVGTDAHNGQISDHLKGFGLSPENFAERGRYVALDSAETPSQFMIGEQPDAAGFERVVARAIRDAAKHSGNDFVFVFGEMVALLCADDNPDAAVRLEQLWNALAERQPFSLYCAYATSCLDKTANLDALTQICAEHALTVPA